MKQRTAIAIITATGLVAIAAGVVYRHVQRRIVYDRFSFDPETAKTEPLRRQQEAAQTATDAIEAGRGFLETLYGKRLLAGQEAVERGELPTPPPGWAWLEPAPGDAVHPDIMVVSAGAGGSATADPVVPDQGVRLDYVLVSAYGYSGKDGRLHCRTLRGWVGTDYTLRRLEYEKSLRLNPKTQDDELPASEHPVVTDPPSAIEEFLCDRFSDWWHH